MLTKTFGVSHIIMSYITYVVHHMSPSQDKKKLSMALTVLHFYNLYTSIHNHLHESLSYNSPLALMSLYSCVTIVLAVVIDRVLTDGMSQERKNEFMKHMLEVLEDYPALPAQYCENIWKLCHRKVHTQENIVPPAPTNTPLESPRLVVDDDIPQLQELLLNENDTLQEMLYNPPTTTPVVELETQENTLENTLEENDEEIHQIIEEDLEEKTHEVIENSCVLL